MKEAIEAGNHTRIKKLNLYVLMSGFIESESTPDKSLQQLLLSTGPLVRVRTVNFIAVFDKKGFNRYSLSETQTQLLAKNIHTYSETFRKLFSNANHIGLCMCFVNNSGLVNSPVEHAFTAMLQDIIGHCPRCFCCTSFKIPANLAHFLHDKSLREITVWYQGDSNVYNELIKRNALSLRKLCIRDAAMLDIVQLTLTQSGTLVYPQMQQLSIDSCSGLINLDHRQPSVNPFPVLRNFACYGRFPFATPIILSANCNQLSSLYLDFDRHLATMLDSRKLLEPHTFKALHTISVGVLGTDFEHIVSGNKIFLWAINASPVISLVTVSGIILTNFEQDVLPSIIFSKTLRELHMPGVHLSIKNNLRLIHGFENLVSAALSFTEASARFSETFPADKDIKEYQLMTTEFPAAIRILKMTTRYHYSTQCAAELFVLVASLLPKIKTVVLVCQNTEKIRLASTIYNIVQNPPYDQMSRITKDTFEFAN
ncbi:hypothetical protein FB645_002296 [Coemansia sp. IMI 203386]|nr:hypothetical protein FB645_002296 [Coemansia sp. IMI 203386]